MAEKNYTDGMTEELLTAYNSEPTIETVREFAEKFNKSARSIIAKLVREGVYQPQARTTKTGEPVVRKSDLVAFISSKTQVPMPSLEKASKQDLTKLAAYFQSC
jgi:hypothetical protein